MAINHDDLAALKSIFKKNPELQEKLRSSTDLKMTSKWLGEIAASNDIPFDTAEYERFFSSIEDSFQHRHISDAELQQVSAGRPHAPTAAMRELTDAEKGWYAFVYGTGVGGAVLSVNSEQLKDGGAKEFSDAVYNGGKTNLAGLV